MKEIRVLKAKPNFTGIITTCDLYEDVSKKDGIIDTDKPQGSIKEYQTVVAVGSSCRNVKEGDIVFINPDRFMVKKYRDGSLKDGVIKENEVIGYNFDIIDIAGKPHMLLNENDIKFVAEEYEFYETEENELIK